MGGDGEVARGGEVEGGGRRAAGGGGRRAAAEEGGAAAGWREDVQGGGRRDGRRGVPRRRTDKGGSGGDARRRLSARVGESESVSEGAGRLRGDKVGIVVARLPKSATANLNSSSAL